MAKDLTGQRFGKLVALRPTDERINGCVVWECQCDCGNTVLVKVNALTTGHKQSCGCLTKGISKRKDITGQRFDKLVAIRATDQRKGTSVVWECLCDCGNTTFAAATHLINGGIKSCGCNRYSYKYPKDLTGMRFGRLVALKPTGDRKGHNPIWECQCDCGNTVNVLRQCLVGGNTRSCGCLHKDNPNGQNKDYTGQRFGDVIALEPTEMRVRTAIVWKCQCDCGNITFISTDKFHRSPDAQSCGCAQKRKKYKKKIQYFAIKNALNAEGVFYLTYDSDCFQKQSVCH